MENIEKHPCSEPESFSITSSFFSVAKFSFGLSITLLRDTTLFFGDFLSGSSSSLDLRSGLGKFIILRDGFSSTPSSLHSPSSAEERSLYCSNQGLWNFFKKSKFFISKISTNGFLQQREKEKSRAWSGRIFRFRPVSGNFQNFGKKSLNFQIWRQKLKMVFEG